MTTPQIQNLATTSRVILPVVRCREDIVFLLHRGDPRVGQSVSIKQGHKFVVMPFERGSAYFFMEDSAHQGDFVMARDQGAETFVNNAVLHGSYEFQLKAIYSSGHGVVSWIDLQSGKLHRYLTVCPQCAGKAAKVDAKPHSCSVCAGLGFTSVV